MSELYVKWNKLSKSSKQINTDASVLRQCAKQIENTRSALHLSGETDVSIKSRLSKDISALYELAERLDQGSQALSSIAQLYQKTESENINR